MTDSFFPQKEMEPKDFLSHQAKLQEEARMALAQAKEMARMQMQIEKQTQVKSPITDIVRGSFCKVDFPDEIFVWNLLIHLSTDWIPVSRQQKANE